MFLKGLWMLEIMILSTWDTLRMSVEETRLFYYIQNIFVTTLIKLGTLLWEVVVYIFFSWRNSLSWLFERDSWISILVHILCIDELTWEWISETYYHEIQLLAMRVQ